MIVSFRAPPSPLAESREHFSISARTVYKIHNDGPANFTGHNRTADMRTILMSVDESGCKENGPPPFAYLHLR